MKPELFMSRALKASSHLLVISLCNNKTFEVSSNFSCVSLTSETILSLFLSKVLEKVAEFFTSFTKSSFLSFPVSPAILKFYCNGLVSYFFVYLIRLVFSVSVRLAPCLLNMSRYSFVVMVPVQLWSTCRYRRRK